MCYNPQTHHFMAKLISLNVEARKHHDLIVPFLHEEKADIICLQEASKELEKILIERGYQTTFSPMCIRTDVFGEFTQGILIASKVPQESRIITYYQIDNDPLSKHQNYSFSYILTKLKISNEIFNIATTHLMDTKDGKEDEVQIAGANELLKYLDEEEPHIICGDFNIPRGFNSLYEKFTARYKDTVPKHYNSSLDKNIHRLGQVELDQPIFEKYMVDYIFTQPPYDVKNVKLVFGVSDHAAIIADISIEGNK